jgi:hypothetical protein
VNAGVLNRGPGVGVAFPFDAVKVEFLLKAATLPRVNGVDSCQRAA